MITYGLQPGHFVCPSSSLAADAGDRSPLNPSERSKAPPVSAALVGAGMQGQRQASQSQVPDVLGGATDVSIPDRLTAVAALDPVVSQATFQPTGAYWSHVLGFKIQHEEGEFPFLHVTLSGDVPAILPTAFQLWAKEKNTERVVFAGQVHPVPIQTRPSYYVLEIRAEPVDALNVMQSMLDTVEAVAPPDPLYTSAPPQEETADSFSINTEEETPLEKALDSDTAGPEHLAIGDEASPLCAGDSGREDKEQRVATTLAALPFLPHWSRRADQIKLSAYHTGRVIQDARPWLKATGDPLVEQSMTPPLAGIEVTVMARWQQQGVQTCDVGAHIARATGEEGIPTLTPRAFEAGWGRFLQRLRHQGIRILESRLDSIPMEALEFSSVSQQNASDSVSSSGSASASAYEHLVQGGVWNQDAYDSGVDSHEGPRCFFPTLHIGRAFQVPYREHVTAYVSAPSSPSTQTGGPTGPVKKRRWVLHPSAAEDLSSGPFFASERGRSAVQYACQMAYTMVHASQRCMRLRCTVPLAAAWAWDLDCDQQLRVPHPTKPGQTIVAKVCAYTLEAQGGADNQWAHIDLAYAPSTSEEVSWPPLPPGQWQEKGPKEHASLPTPFQTPKVHIRNPARLQRRYQDHGGSLSKSLATHMEVELRTRRVHKPSLYRYQVRFPQEALGAQEGRDA